MQETEKNDLFCDYYLRWIHIYKEGAIRKVTLDKYYMTQAWLVKLVPDVRMCDLTRIVYQQLIHPIFRTGQRVTGG